MQRSELTGRTGAIASPGAVDAVAENTASKPAPLHKLSSYFLPPGFLNDPEVTRRAQLLVGFGTLGGLFGLLYAVFYFLIGHYWGTGMIVFCTAGVALTPFLMRWPFHFKENSKWLRHASARCCMVGC